MRAGSNAWDGVLFEQLRRDGRIAVRSLRRSPGFAVTAIATLALGIGLATAVFSVANALLIRRLPVRDQSRIVTLWGTSAAAGFDDYPLDLDGERDFARTTRALSQVGYYNFEGAFPKTVVIGNRVIVTRAALVSGNLFDVMGARPLFGRALHDADDAVGAAPVVLLSYAGWQRMFGGDRSVIGRQIEMYDTGVPATVVGVMPPGLELPRGTELWSPIVHSADPKALQYVNVHLVGRLAQRATTLDARDELASFFQRTATLPWQRDLHGVVQTLPDFVLGDTRTELLVFVAAAMLLLLITCVNVANLVLVRALGRGRELAVRSALGAGRARVIALLLAENLVLAVVGGGLGVIVAVIVTRLLVAVAPSDMPRLNEIHFSGAVVGGAAGITIAALVLFGIAPAWTMSRIELQDALRAGTRQSGGRRSGASSRWFVGGQMTLAMIVLAVAGLLVRSLANLERVNLSIEPSHLLVADLAFSRLQASSVAQQNRLIDRIVLRVEAIPGVLAASSVVSAPFAHGWEGKPSVEGQPPDNARNNPLLNIDVVTPHYLAALGIPLLAGRAFTTSDRTGATAAIILSESAAKRYWPGQNPIGKRLIGAGGKLTVVGVAADTRYRDLRDPGAAIYFPLAQSVFPFAPATLVIRTTGEPTTLAPTLRRVVEEFAPGATVASAAPFASFLDGPLAEPRLDALLLGLFAGAAVLLVAIGMFGVMATVVRQRTKEIGIRMALGASPRRVEGDILGGAVRVVAIGGVIGLGSSLLAGRAIRNLLFEVRPNDPATLVAVAASLAAVALLAAYVPSRRAAKIDPVRALRDE